MRSRYSAFVVEDVDYLLATWHPQQVGNTAGRNELIDGFRATLWRGLRVIDCAASQDAGQGYVDLSPAFMTSDSGATALFTNVPALSASINAGIMSTAGILYPAGMCCASVDPASNLKNVVDK